VTEPAPRSQIGDGASAVLLGATTIEGLQSDLGTLTVQLDAEVVERLDRIWPGPGGSPVGVRPVKLTPVPARPLARLTR